MKEELLSMTEIGRLLCRNPSSISRQLARAGYGGEGDGKRKKYSIDTVKEILSEATSRDTKSDKNGMERKRDLECEILEIRRDEMLGERILMSDHIGVLREVSAILLDGMSRFVERVSSHSKDPEALSAAKLSVFEIREELSAAVENATEK